MAVPKKKYEKLMNDTDVKRWYDEMSRSSRITADTCLRRLGSFCNTVGRDPKAILELGDKEITDLISDQISAMEKHGFAGSYISSTMKAVNSWIRHNDRKLTRKIKIRDQDATPTLKDERIPSTDELKRIFASGDPRARTACVLMAHSGLRPEVIGSYLGDDGLRIADIPDMEINGSEVTFRKIPAMIVVRSDLSKARNQYVTFTGNEGCFYLKAYIEERINEGERITANSPIVVPAKYALRNENSFIRTINIGDIVRQAIRKAGYPWRPYVLRAFFDTQLLMAESKGLIMRDYRAFFMGHKGDIEHRYTVNKHILPEDLLEDMRNAYERSTKFLETESKGIKEEDFIKTQRETAIMILETAFSIQLTDEQKESLISANTEDFQKMLSEIFKEKKAMDLNGGNKYKTIPENKLEEYLNKGFELVQIYPSGDKAIVRLP